MFLSAWVCSGIDEYRKALFSSRRLRFLVALLVVPALRLISAAFLPVYAERVALLSSNEIAVTAVLDTLNVDVYGICCRHQQHQIKTGA